MRTAAGPQSSRARKRSRRGPTAPYVLPPNEAQKGWRAGLRHRRSTYGRSLGAACHVALSPSSVPLARGARAHAHNPRPPEPPCGCIVPRALLACLPKPWSPPLAPSPWRARPRPLSLLRRSRAQNAAVRARCRAQQAEGAARSETRPRPWVAARRPQPEPAARPAASLSPSAAIGLLSATGCGVGQLPARPNGSYPAAALGPGLRPVGPPTRSVGARAGRQ